MKKLLCLTLVLMLCFCNVFAAENDADKALAEVNLLPFGAEYSADEPVTRAEFAKIMCQLVNLSKTAQISYSGKCTFPDVNENSEFTPYINLCAERGILHGFEDGTFRPEEHISVVQAAKLITYELGYSMNTERLGGYPNGIMLQGVSLGIFNGIDAITDASLKKGDAVKVLANSIDVPLLMQTSFGEVEEFTVMNGKNGVALMTIRSMYLEGEEAAK